MNLKKLVLVLVLVLLAAITGCSKNVLLDEQDSKLLNYNFKISESKHIDKTLEKQNYSYSTSIEKKFIALITYRDKDASMQQYLIDKNGTLDLTVSKNSNFIISLPANRIVTYTWNIKNRTDNGIIQFENRSWISITAPKSEKGAAGADYSRQNFYFKPIKSGNEKIVMRYEHQTLQQDGFFEVTINIKIE